MANPWILWLRVSEAKTIEQSLKAIGFGGTIVVIGSLTESRLIPTILNGAKAGWC